ncbi:MAG: hypothetical protein KKF46_06830 [Nanoarchaeota archaeon]|nr:hypothetical protein [Nanoarchaeota archaeon]MBU1322043.1 hypothetical protein [Nanoarchaeota archaeon]MBU1597235.1 hypothetical protein [Nanoarchaeota archaeon]MBU2440720.1 hypothetical protein [Nanoarchaeota archaeon]
MKKLSRLVLIAGLSITALLSGCNSPTIGQKNHEPTKIQSLMYKITNKKTSQIYGDNIIYQNFSEIEFENIPKDALYLPSDLNRAFAQPHVNNPALLENIVFEETNKLSLTAEKIKNMNAKELILLAVDIVSNRLNYFLVDHDKNFIAKYGEFLPIEKYLDLGQGDCDKYASATIAVFNELKKVNQNSCNVYLSNNEEGGLTQLHDWNSIIILTPEKIILSHIDTTFYDNDGELEGEKGFHIPKDAQELNAKFFASIYDFQTSYDMYLKLVAKEEDIPKKVEHISFMSYLSYKLKDNDKLDQVRISFNELNLSETSEVYRRNYDSILYYSYMLGKNTSQKESAEEFRQELFNKFPDAYWTKEIKKHKK